MKKVLHHGNYLYLNLVIIHPEILKEINLIKKLIKSFNKSRVNIWKYKDLITNFHKKKPDFVKIEQNLTSEKPSINDTVARLAGKCSPYGKEEFKEISLRAFLSIGEKIKHTSLKLLMR